MKFKSRKPNNTSKSEDSAHTFTSTKINNGTGKIESYYYGSAKPDFLMATNINNLKISRDRRDPEKPKIGRSGLQKVKELFEKLFA